MATETQERTNAVANNVEWATKAEVAEMSAKVDEHGREIASIRVQLKWVIWILGAIFMVMMVLCAAALVIALQI